MIETKFLDVLAVTETWHCASEDLALRRCAPAGYSIVDAARQDARPSSTAARGGGVALIHSNRFTSKRLVLDVKPTTFEVLGCTLRSASVAAVYVVIYRPSTLPLSDTFFDELTSLLEIVATFPQSNSHRW